MYVIIEINPHGQGGDWLLDARVYGPFHDKMVAQQWAEDNNIPAREIVAVTEVN